MKKDKNFSEEEKTIYLFDRTANKLITIKEKDLKRLGAGEEMYPNFKFDLHANDEEIYEEFGV